MYSCADTDRLWETIYMWYHNSSTPFVRTITMPNHQVQQNYNHITYDQQSNDEQIEQYNCTLLQLLLHNALQHIGRRVCKK
ncbi:hypothetical protein T05_14665 [Trichinella murrelli]|uniref:Uncharacterized protein n=1 Tax=Trichinella murrelli TaxID=144512 RepID=A0A0V0TDZ8_9BILA|nr:hypothetical protein T05_14665 [Trichinella murrelli]